MIRVLMKSKIHGATVTEANLRYTGSITIDKNLLKATDMCEFERVQIVNLHNGTRVETYIMEGEAGSGVICMNGAAARWAEVGDKVIIISYAHLTEKERKKHKPSIVFVDERNRIKK
jgi:aspartate 1-decarboxylase